LIKCPCIHVTREYKLVGSVSFQSFYLSGKHRETSQLLLFARLSLSLFLTSVLMRRVVKSNIDTIRARLQTALIAPVLHACCYYCQAKWRGELRGRRINEPADLKRIRTVPGDMGARNVLLGRDGREETARAFLPFLVL
jgi:hypothetical protein